MSINSRAKGKDGELEFAEYLRLAGFEARRGQQFHGGGDSPDVVTSVPGVHFEVKRVEAGNPYKWLAQAESDCPTGEISMSPGACPPRFNTSEPAKMPVVAHRKNRQNWIAILGMDDFIDLVRKANASDNH